MRSLLEKRHQRLVHAKNFAIFVHCLLGLLALQATLPGASAAVASDVDASVAEKRNWHQLQGAWGKRNYLEGDSGSNDEPEEVIIPEQWIPMMLSGGPGSEPSIIYVPKASSMYTGYDNNDFLSAFDADPALNKVKRRNRQLMSRNSASAYGKREPNWNNLKGMWGKRSAKDWASLTGTWGRR